MHSVVLHANLLLENIPLGQNGHIRKGQHGTGFRFAPIHWTMLPQLCSDGLKGGGGGRSTHHFEYGYETGLSYLHKLVHIYKSTFSTFKPGFITITIPVLPN